MTENAVSIDFNQRPYIVIWEVTQASDFACVHCRARAAQSESVSSCPTKKGNRIGDPIKRPDLFELIEHTQEVGVRVSLTPSATPLLTHSPSAEAVRSGTARRKSRWLARCGA